MIVGSKSLKRQARPVAIAVVLVSIGTVMLAGGVSVYYARQRERATAVDSTRRVNGDIVVLSFAPGFPNIENVRHVVESTDLVERARIFTIFPVRIESQSAHSPGLLKLAPLDQSLAQQLGISAHAIPAEPGQLPELAFGESLASRLRLRIGDSLTVHVTGDGQTAKDASVRCRLGWIVDWGLAYHNNQLIFGDLRSASAFGLSPVGIEIITSSPDARRRVAKDLQARLGSLFKVLSLEDLFATRASFSEVPSR